MKPRTQQSYSSVIRLYLTLNIGRYVLTKLNGQHVQTMLNKLTAQGLSARTVQYVRAVLRRALNQAIKWGLLARNAATQAEGPRVEKYQIEPLTISQAQQLLDAVSEHRLEALYRVALSLGLRRGEVLALRWADVNFERRTLRIAATLHQGGQFGTPKSKTGIRTLSLPDELIDALREHWRVQQEERALLGPNWKEHGLVFASEVGTPIEPRNLIRQFKKILERAGLPLTIRFHDLRHSAASLMIAQGVHLSVIKDILGHSQISITADIYGHVAAETQREASEKLSQALNKRAKNGN